ncbi:Cro/CI family transcriptional regulator [Cobetia amphilecti]|uniref:Cro/CI family transcriptional regulator n=1 Tax=Cobetia amphilecti TaxID=1055104 RepID=UPI00349F39E4
MTKKELADYYGSMAAAARALGRTRGAIQQWPDDLPARVQFEIEGRTKGKLKANPGLRNKNTA